MYVWAGYIRNNGARSKAIKTRVVDQTRRIQNWRHRQTPEPKSNMESNHHHPLPEDQELLKHVTDVHCHPTDSPIATEAVRACAITVCAMASNPGDQEKVKALALEFPDKVIPCFG